MVGSPGTAGTEAMAGDTYVRAWHVRVDGILPSPRHSQISGKERREQTRVSPRSEKQRATESHIAALGDESTPSTE